MSSLALATLSIPAMLGAGLSSGAHCAVMCGMLHAGNRGGATMFRHVGRLAAYALLGAVAGGAGQWLLRTVAWLPVGNSVRVVLLPVLLLVLLLRSRRRSAAACCAPARAMTGRTTMLRQAMAGFSMGLVPCVPLYAAGAYAALSASAASGALLLFAFGVGTSPAVQAGAWAWARAGRTRASSYALRERPFAVGVVGSVVLLSMWFVASGPTLWCLS